MMCDYDRAVLAGEEAPEPVENQIDAIYEQKQRQEIIEGTFA